MTPELKPNILHVLLVLLSPSFTVRFPGSSGYEIMKDTEDQETATAERPAVYPYVMERLDDAISTIPFDEFDDVWRLVKDAEVASRAAGRSSSGSIDQRQLILNPAAGSRKSRQQQQQFLSPNPSLAQVLAISLESVSVFLFPPLSLSLCLPSCTT